MLIEQVAAEERRKIYQITDKGRKFAGRIRTLTAFSAGRQNYLADGGISMKRKTQMGILGFSLP